MADVKLSLKGLTVMIAVPVNRDFPRQFDMSMVATVKALCDLGVAFDYRHVAQCSIIQTARSKVANLFLASKMNRLFMLDSDMEWDAAEFLRILALSSVLPVVGATYPRKKGPRTEFMMHLLSTAVEANEYGCIDVGGMGLGFTCVQREVMERLDAISPEVVNEHGQLEKMAFRCSIVGKSFIGEDMNFFHDCRKLGYQVWADPNVTLGHVGDKEYRGKFMDALYRSPVPEPVEDDINVEDSVDIEDDPIVAIRGLVGAGI